MEKFSKNVFEVDTTHLAPIAAHAERGRGRRALAGAIIFVFLVFTAAWLKIRDEGPKLTESQLTADSLSLLAHACTQGTKHSYPDVLCYLRYRHYGSVEAYLRGEPSEPRRGLIPGVPDYLRHSIRAQWKLVVRKLRNAPGHLTRCPLNMGFDTLTYEAFDECPYSVKDSFRMSSNEDMYYYLSYFSNVGGALLDVNGFAEFEDRPAQQANALIRRKHDDEKSR